MIDGSLGLLMVVGGAIIGVVFASVTAVLGRLGSDEVSGWIPVWSNRFLDSAVSLVPPEHQDRYRKEWRAELTAFKTRPLSGLRFAWRLRRRAHSVGEVLCETQSASNLFTSEAPAVEREPLDAEAIAAIVRRVVDKTRPTNERRPEEDLIESLMEARDDLEVDDALAEIAHRYLNNLRAWRREEARRKRTPRQTRPRANRRFRPWL